MCVLKYYISQIHKLYIWKWENMKNIYKIKRNKQKKWSWFLGWLRLIWKNSASLIIKKLLIFSVFFLNSLVQNLFIIFHIDNVLSSYISFDLSFLLSSLRYEDYCKIAWRVKMNRFSISAISQIYTMEDNLLLVMYLKSTRDELSVVV